jgi:hypothetical protein
VSRPLLSGRSKVRALPESPTKANACSTTNLTFRQDVGHSGIQVAPVPEKCTEIPLTPAEKLDARRTNEGLKLSANFLNTMAVGLFIGGVITPEANGRELTAQWLFFLLVAAAGLHLVGRLLVADLKPEE